MTMEETNMQYQQSVRKAAGSIMVTPSGQAWERVASRLEAHKARGKAKRYRIIAISSAAAVVLILLSSIVLNRDLIWRSHDSYVDSIHPVSTNAEMPQEGIYTVASVRMVDSALKEQFN